MSTARAMEALIAAATAAVFNVANPRGNLIAEAIEEYERTVVDKNNDPLLAQVKRLADGNLPSDEVVNILTDWSRKIEVDRAAGITSLTKEAVAAAAGEQLHAMVNSETCSMLFLTMSQVAIIQRKMTLMEYLAKHGIKNIVGTKSFAKARPEMKALQYLFFGNCPDVSSRMVAFAMCLNIPLEHASIMTGIARAQAIYHSPKTVAESEIQCMNDIEVYKSDNLVIKSSEVNAFLLKHADLAPIVFGSAAYLHKDHTNLAADVDISVAADSNVVRSEIMAELCTTDGFQHAYPGSTLLQKKMGDGTNIDVSITTKAEQAGVVMNTNALKCALEDSKVSKLVVEVKNRMRNAGVKTRPLGGLSSFAIAIMTLSAGMKTGVLKRMDANIHARGWLVYSSDRPLDNSAIVTVMACMRDSLTHSKSAFFITPESPNTVGWKRDHVKSPVWVFEPSGGDERNAANLTEPQRTNLVALMNHAVTCSSAVPCGANEIAALVATRNSSDPYTPCEISDKRVMGFSLEDRPANRIWHVAIAEKEPGGRMYIVEIAFSKKEACQRAMLSIKRDTWYAYTDAVVSTGAILAGHKRKPFTLMALSARKPMVTSWEGAIRVYGCINDCMCSEEDAQFMVSPGVYDLKSCALAEYRAATYGRKERSWIQDLSAHRMYDEVEEKAEILRRISVESEDPLEKRLEDWVEDDDELDKETWEEEREARLIAAAMALSMES
jgi:hypothetical protein